MTRNRSASSPLTSLSPGVPGTAGAGLAAPVSAPASGIGKPMSNPPNYARATSVAHRTGVGERVRQLVPRLRHNGGGPAYARAPPPTQERLSQSPGTPAVRALLGWLLRRGRHR